MTDTATDAELVRHYMVMSYGYSTLDRGALDALARLEQAANRLEQAVKVQTDLREGSDKAHHREYVARLVAEARVAELEAEVARLRDEYFEHVGTDVI